MDRREETSHETNQYQKELDSQQNVDQAELDKQYVMIDGVKFRIPYKTIKKVVFSNIKKEELKDIEHATRLQYRLMLKDAVLKATVNFIKGTITVIYNPLAAENLKETIGRAELVEFLEKEGVNIDKNSIEERNYDYIKEFYSYAFNPPSIREHPPYAYTMEQWRKMKPDWEARQKEYEIKKRADFKAWQERYEKEYILGIKPEPKKQGLLGSIFGKKPKTTEEKGKGFWFHGV